MTRWLISLALVLTVAACDSGGDAGTTDTTAPPSDTTADDGDSQTTSPPDTTPPVPACVERAAVAPATDFFTDISASSGIQKDNHDPDPAVAIPINDHSRLAFADLDGDGWDDIVMHSLFPNPQAGIPFEHLVFMNNRDGTFRDHSDASGLRDIQAGVFAFGDVDNDGDTDIYAALDVPLAGKTSLILLNGGDATFTRVTNAGPDDARLPTYSANAVFFDYDADGKLDLFVGNGHTTAAVPDFLFQGNGDGTFADVTGLLQGNVAHPSNGSVACDYDNDGDLDLFVGTYGVSSRLGANLLHQNDGTAFSEVAVSRGFASQPGGNTWIAATGYGKTPEPGKGPGEYIGSNSFGIDCGDINNDGLMDIFMGTISHPGGAYTRTWSDPTQILINGGPSANFAFTNEAGARGLPFNEGDLDAAMVDFDNDGLMDLSLSRESKYEGGYTTDEQKGWFGLMRQQPDGDFASLGLVSGLNDLDAAYIASISDCSNGEACPADEACLSNRCRTPCATEADCTSPFEMCHSAGFCRLINKMKGAQNHAWSDIDHDGDLDLLIGGRDQGGGRPNFLFRNDIGQQNRWLAIRLVGDGKLVNRGAIGARVTVTAGAEKLVREVRACRGLGNSCDTKVLHFGIGDRACGYVVEVRWPDGTTATLPAERIVEEQYMTLTYPDVLTAD